jgi:hypothetical protein
MGVRKTKRKGLLRERVIRSAQEVPPEIIDYRRHGTRYKVLTKAVPVYGFPMVLYSLDGKFWSSSKRNLVDIHVRIERIMRTGSEIDNTEV